MEARALIIGVLVGCGGEIVGSDGGPLPDAACFDAALEDVLVDVNVPLDDGGGSFQCADAACDGRTHYCMANGTGAYHPQSCVPLPSCCMPANCECLPNENMSPRFICICSHATTGDGLMVSCGPP